MIIKINNNNTIWKIWLSSEDGVCLCFFSFTICWTFSELRSRDRAASCTWVMDLYNALISWQLECVGVAGSKMLVTIRLRFSRILPTCTSIYIHWRNEMP